MEVIITCVSTYTKILSDKTIRPRILARAWLLLEISQNVITTGTWLLHAKINITIMAIYMCMYYAPPNHSTVKGSTSTCTCSHAPQAIYTMYIQAEFAISWLFDCISRIVYKIYLENDLNYTCIHELCTMCTNITGNYRHAFESTYLSPPLHCPLKSTKHKFQWTIHACIHVHIYIRSAAHGKAVHSVRMLTFGWNCHYPGRSNWNGCQSCQLQRLS